MLVAISGWDAPQEGFEVTKRESLLGAGGVWDEKRKHIPARLSYRWKNMQYAAGKDTAGKRKYLRKGMV